VTIVPQSRVSVALPQTLNQENKIYLSAHYFIATLARVSQESDAVWFWALAQHAWPHAKPSEITAYLHNIEQLRYSGCIAESLLAQAHRLPQELYGFAQGMHVYQQLCAQYDVFSFAEMAREALLQLLQGNIPEQFQNLQRIIWSTGAPITPALIDVANILAQRGVSIRFDVAFCPQAERSARLHRLESLANEHLEVHLMPIASNSTWPDIQLYLASEASEITKAVLNTIAHRQVEHPPAVVAVGSDSYRQLQWSLSLDGYCPTPEPGVLLESRLFQVLSKIYNSGGIKNSEGALLAEAWLLSGGEAEMARWLEHSGYRGRAFGDVTEWITSQAPKRAQLLTWLDLFPNIPDEANLYTYMNIFEQFWTQLQGDTAPYAQAKKRLWERLSPLLHLHTDLSREQFWQLCSHAAQNIPLGHIEDSSSRFLYTLAEASTLGFEDLCLVYLPETPVPIEGAVFANQPSWRPYLEKAFPQAYLQHLWHTHEEIDAHWLDMLASARHIHLFMVDAPVDFSPHRMWLERCRESSRPMSQLPQPKAEQSKQQQQIAKQHTPIIYQLPADAQESLQHVLASRVWSWRILEQLGLCRFRFYASIIAYSARYAHQTLSLSCDAGTESQYLKEAWTWAFQHWQPNTCLEPGTPAERAFYEVFQLRMKSSAIHPHLHQSFIERLFQTLAQGFKAYMKQGFYESTKLHVQYRCEEDPTASSAAYTLSWAPSLLPVKLAGTIDRIALGATAEDHWVYDYQRTLPLQDFRAYGKMVAIAQICARDFPEYTFSFAYLETTTGRKRTISIEDTVLHLQQSWQDVMHGDISPNPIHPQICRSCPHVHFCQYVAQ
jgi:hypothetical protein